MRILGLDLGEKTIGVALSDPLGWTAQGITTLRRGKDKEADLAAIAALVEKFNVERVVIGLPLNMDGSMGPQALAALEFAGELQRRLNLPVETWDERLTTVAAEKVLLEGDVSRRGRKKVLDKLAAALILQNYLDRRT